MNKLASLMLICAAILALAACAPAAPGAPAAGVGEATALPEAPPAALTAEVAPGAAPTAIIDAKPVPMPPSDGSRPLAELAPQERADRFSGPADTYVKPGVTYIATIVTDKGDIVAELYPDTPQSLNNFVTLSLNGFYDGLTFHRVEPGFVIQGGDPLGEGNGGPGYTIPGEFAHTHPRGALAWARTGDEVNPDRRSSGSQFYITLSETPFLDGTYSVFGQVIEGLEVADQIAVGDKIQRIDIRESETSQLPTPTPTPEPKAPTGAIGRPLAAVPVAEREGYYNTPPETNLDTSKTYQATIKTSKGDIVIDLEGDKATATVSNLKLLADLGFYDGMPVSHVEPETYALFGSPAGRPDSDVGYLIPIEPAAEASSIVTGTVAMYPVPAMTGDLMASGSQFFISMMELPSEGTPINVVGTVSKGMEVVSALEIGDVVESVVFNAK